jgi:hypothetical protein
MVTFQADPSERGVPPFPQKIGAIMPVTKGLAHSYRRESTQAPHAGPRRADCARQNPERLVSGIGDGGACGGYWGKLPAGTEEVGPESLAVVPPIQSCSVAGRGGAGPVNDGIPNALAF